LTESIHLVDVNVVIARIFESHEHHQLAVEWFNTPDLKWALCPWSEAGFLRYATRENRISMREATGILEDLAQHPGYHYHGIAHDWRTLTKTFLHRLHGHKQITDALLLGLALQDDLILVTFDRAILHMAGNSGKVQFVEQM